MSYQVQNNKVPPDSADTSIYGRVKVVGTKDFINNSNNGRVMSPTYGNLGA